jgi:hypothetical protein
VAEEEDVILRLRLRDRLQFAAQLREASKQIEAVGTSTRKVGEETERTAATTERGSKAWGQWGVSAQSAVVGSGVGYGLYQIGQSVLSVAENVLQTGVSFNAMKENAQITFSVLLNSGAKAKTLVGDLFNLAQKSSFFRYQDVLTAAQSLLTFGFSARSIIPDLKTLANVASLHPERGSQGISELAIILGQIHQSGRLLGQDARQLEQLGINPYVAVARRLRETPALVMQQAQQGLISSKVAISAIMDYADQRFGGLADRLSKTTSGKFANLQDLLTAAAGAVTAPLMPAINADMDRLVTWLQKPSTQREIHQIGIEIERTAAAVAPLVSGGARLAAVLTAVIGLPVVRTLQALSPEFQVLGDLMGYASDHSTALTIAFGAMTGPMWLLVETTRSLNWVLGQVQSAWDWLSKHSDISLSIHYSGPGSGLFSFAGSLPGLGGLGLPLLGPAGGVPAGLLGGLGLLSKIPFQAEGGVTLDSGWSVVGEKGPELHWMDKGAVVAPLDRIGAAAPAAGGDLHVHLSLDGREVTTAVLRNIDDMRSRH